MDATAGATKSASASAPARELGPEKPASIWTRRLVIVAFWAVALFLGLPLWTWTTSIHRSALPLEAMNAWAEGKACQLQYPLHIGLQAADLTTDQANNLASSLELLLSNQQSIPMHQVHIHLTNVSVGNVTNNVLTIVLDTPASITTPEIKLRTWEAIVDVRYPVHHERDVSQVAAFLAPQIAAIFEDESASLWFLLKDTPRAKSFPSLSPSPEKMADLERRTTRAFKYASTYHLTFSMFTPNASPSAWAINEALHEYISPLVTRLSSISEFTIDTQVQLYASFSPSIAGPIFDDTNQQWSLQHGDLTGFVNAAEWPLSPSIGSGPTINFVLYVPSPDKRPLLLEAGGGSSWIIPQWGGVQIHNAPSKESDALTLDDLRPDMLIFADQLAALLGVPQSPPSLSLRMSSLTRERSTALILSASSTLGALSRLTLKLTSIAIPESVAKSVDETLLRLERACADLRDGRYQMALENARTAEAEVEKAFFEPSMVGQVYFPEEHKVAVYVPLLGPMAVPLIMAGMREIKKLRERKSKAP